MGEWFSTLGQNISSGFAGMLEDTTNKFNEWKEEKRLEKEQREKEKEEQRLKEEEEKRKEEEQKQNNENQINDIANNVNSLIGDKFGAFYSLKDFLSEFWNAIFNADSEIPNFNITLPAFCGGGTYNVLDLRFYNQYRDYIHGIIAGICYFVFIKRLYHNLPNIIR